MGASSVTCVWIRFEGNGSTACIARGICAVAAGVDERDRGRFPMVAKAPVRPRIQGWSSREFEHISAGGYEQILPFHGNVCGGG